LSGFAAIRITGSDIRWKNAGLEMILGRQIAVQQMSRASSGLVSFYFFCFTRFPIRPVNRSFCFLFAPPAFRSALNILSWRLFQPHAPGFFQSV
jgi:hypothetical protein